MLETESLGEDLGDIARTADDPHSFKNQEQVGRGLVPVSGEQGLRFLRMASRGYFDTGHAAHFASRQRVGRLVNSQGLSSDAAAPQPQHPSVPLYEPAADGCSATSGGLAWRLPTGTPAAHFTD